MQVNKTRSHWGKNIPIFSHHKKCSGWTCWKVLMKLSSTLWEAHTTLTWDVINPICAMVDQSVSVWSLMKTQRILPYSAPHGIHVWHIFSIYHKKQPTVGIHTINGPYGYRKWNDCSFSAYKSLTQFMVNGRLILKFRLIVNQWIVDQPGNSCIEMLPSSINLKRNFHLQSRFLFVSCSRRMLCFQLLCLYEINGSYANWFYFSK